MTQQKILGTAREIWDRTQNIDAVLEYIDGAMDELVWASVTDAVSRDRVEGPSRWAGAPYGSSRWLPS